MHRLLKSVWLLGALLVGGCSLMLDDFSTRYDGGARDADADDGTDAGDDGTDAGDEGDAGCGDCGANAHCVSGHCECISDYLYCSWDPDWWDPDWPIRLKIVFDASQVTQNLENVPVLVELNGARVDYELIKDNGADLRFTDASGAELSYQVDHWQVRDTSYIWVKMPQIAAGSAAEVLWMYYGNPQASGLANTSAAWDGFYNAVYHFNNNAEDSCSRQNNGQVYNATYTPYGKFGGAYDFTPEASNRIEAGTNSASAVVGTFEGWVKYEGDTGYPDVNYMIFGLSKNYCGSRNWIQLGAEDTGIPEGFRSRYEDYPNCGTGFARVTTDEVALPGGWHHVAYTWDNSAHEYRIYVDGTEKGNNVTDTPAAIEHDAVRIGAIYEDGHDGFEGVIDEARISGVVRSADWIRFQYCTAAQTCVSYFNQ